MRCPTHNTRLYGGLVLYQCDSDGGHAVRAADLDHEYHPQAVAA